MDEHRRRRRIHPAGGVDVSQPFAYPLALEQLTGPLFADARAAWFWLTEGADAFRLGRHGDEGRIFSQPDICGPRTAVVAVDPDLPVDEWRYVWRGDGFRDQHNRPMPAARIGDYPASGLRAIANPTMLHSVAAARPTAFLLNGPGPRGPVTLEVLRLPVVDARGGTVRLVCMSHMLRSLAGEIHVGPWTGGKP